MSDSVEFQVHGAHCTWFPSMGDIYIDGRRLPIAQARSLVEAMEKASSWYQRMVEEPPYKFTGGPAPSSMYAHDENERLSITTGQPTKESIYCTDQLMANATRISVPGRKTVEGSVDVTAPCCGATLRMALVMEVVQPGRIDVGAMDLRTSEEVKAQREALNKMKGIVWELCVSCGARGEECSCDRPDKRKFWSAHSGDGGGLREVTNDQIDEAVTRVMGKKAEPEEEEAWVNPNLMPDGSLMGEREDSVWEEDLPEIPNHTTFQGSAAYGSRSGAKMKPKNENVAFGHQDNKPIQANMNGPYAWSKEYASHPPCRCTLQLDEVKTSEREEMLKLIRERGARSLLLNQLQSVRDNLQKLRDNTPNSTYAQALQPVYARICDALKILYLDAEARTPEELRLDELRMRLDWLQHQTLLEARDLESRKDSDPMDYTIQGWHARLKEELLLAHRTYLSLRDFAGGASPYVDRDCQFEEWEGE